MPRALPRKHDVLSKVRVMKARQRRDEIAPLPISPEQSDSPFAFEWKLISWDGTGYTATGDPMEYSGGVRPKYVSFGYDSPDNAPANPAWGDDGYFLHLRGVLNIAYQSDWTNNGEVFAIPMTGRVLGSQPREIRVKVGFSGMSYTGEALLKLSTESTGDSSGDDPATMILRAHLNIADPPTMAPADVEVDLGALYSESTNGGDAKGELRMAWS